MHAINKETLVPENVFIYSRTDPKGRITEANQAFADLSGYSVEEMLGKPHNMIRHPDMPKEAFADLWKSLKAGRPWQGVVKNLRKDGGFYWVFATISPGKRFSSPPALLVRILIQCGSSPIARLGKWVTRWQRQRIAAELA